MRYVLTFFVMAVSVCTQVQRSEVFAPAHREATAVASPGVLPDHRVVIRIQAPNAAEKSLVGDWIAHASGSAGSLQKESLGLGVITEGPLVPDFHTYALTVDGVRTLDQLVPVSSRSGATTFSMR